MSNKRVNITQIFRNAGGSRSSSREVSAECSETVAFALYMLQLVDEMPPLTAEATPDQVKFRAAAGDFLKAAERLRVSGNGSKGAKR